jgi:hypothetical protein
VVEIFFGLDTTDQPATRNVQQIVVDARGSLCAIKAGDDDDGADDDAHSYR